MKTKSLAAICGSITLAATTTLAELANEPAPPDTQDAVYEEFARSGVFDAELSNAKANELVYRGLSSDNPRLVRLTLEALGAHAMSSALREAVVQRNFAAVPQFKESLIALWHSKVGEESHVLVLGNVREVSQGMKAARGGNLWAAAVTFVPDWIIIPRVLAANFPGDDDVYALVWEFLEMHPTAQEQVGWSLLFFNQGQFKGPEVDRLRIEGIRNDDQFTFVHAVEGLAMSRPEGGIEALISSLRANKRPEREKLLVDAIVSYGPEAAIPLLDEEGLERIRRITPLQW